MGLSRDRLSVEDDIVHNQRSINGLSCEPGPLAKEYVGDPHYKMQAQDNVNHPPHYNNSPAKCECGRRIECIDITRHHSFNVGNAIKYLWRCDHKGASIEDLRKAIWYIQDEIKERLKNGS